MSSELPLCASNEYDSWHITQYCRSTRAPPWNVRFSWQPLQVSLSTISRPEATGPPDAGMKVNTPLFAGMFVGVIEGEVRISRPTRCTRLGSYGMSAMPCRLCANR